MNELCKHKVPRPLGPQRPWRPWGVSYRARNLAQIFINILSRCRTQYPRRIISCSHR